jgi:hypothetical protein
MREVMLTGDSKVDSLLDQIEETDQSIRSDLSKTMFDKETTSMLIRELQGVQDLFPQAEAYSIDQDTVHDFLEMVVRSIQDAVDQGVLPMAFAGEFPKTNQEAKMWAGKIRALKAKPDFQRSFSRFLSEYVPEIETEKEEMPQGPTAMDRILTAKMRS